MRSSLRLLLLLMWLKCLKIGIMKNIFLFFLFLGVCSCSVNAINPPSDVTEKQLSDDELMTLVQKQTFRYFWDFAHPESGLARERSNGGAEVVTLSLIHI